MARGTEAKRNLCSVHFS